MFSFIYGSQGLRHEIHLQKVPSLNATAQKEKNVDQITFLV